MKRQIIILAAVACAATLPAQDASVWLGPSTRTAVETPPANTGLRMVIVAESTSGQFIYYKPQSGTVTWQRYSSLGGGYAEDMAPQRADDGSLFVPASTDDMGYIITDGSTQICFWVVNYDIHAYDVSSLDIESSDCDRVYLRATPAPEAIAYYTINGRRVELDRGITLSYNTMTYDEGSNIYNETRADVSYASLSHTFSAPVALCNTQFTLHPDKYASLWDIGHDVVSQSFVSDAVEAHSKATQERREADNEQPLDVELGGSAPCEITFSAAVTDAAVYRRWEMSLSPEFEDVTYTYDSLEFTFTFTEAGVQYVRFTANNAAATCEYIGDTYTVTIGESYLECPNAFSPGASEGVNDEWKVSYRSIIEFDCHIFNRWGKELAHLTDPSQGWDGKAGGKVVGSGVYFYVIKARGSDGKDYNLAGDINVIGSRANTNTGAVVE